MGEENLGQEVRMSIKWTDRELELLQYLHPPKASLKQIKTIFDELGYKRTYAAIEKQSQRSGSSPFSVKLNEEETEAINEVLASGFAEENLASSIGGVNQVFRRAEIPTNVVPLEPEKNLLQYTGQVKEFTLDVGKSKAVELIPIGDVHFGNHQCNEEYLLGVVDYIKNKKNCYWFGMGDLLESIPANYKIPTWGQKLTPEDQFRGLLAILKPVSHKALWLIEGNHEERIVKSTSISLTRLMADMFGAHFHAAPNYLKVTVKSSSGAQGYLFVTNHGQSAALSNDREFESLRNTLPGADVYCLGHDHRLRASPGVHYTQAGIKKFFCIRTGCILNFPMYALKKLYTPTPVGLAKLTLKAESHSIFPDVTGEF